MVGQAQVSDCLLPSSRCFSVQLRLLNNQDNKKCKMLSLEDKVNIISNTECELNQVDVIRSTV